MSILVLSTMYCVTRSTPTTSTMTSTTSRWHYHYQNNLYSKAPKFQRPTFTSHTLVFSPLSSFNKRLSCQRLALYLLSHIHNRTGGGHHTQKVLRDKHWLYIWGLLKDQWVLIVYASRKQFILYRLLLMKKFVLLSHLQQQKCSRNNMQWFFSSKKRCVLPLE